ncbi:hypothetical protein NQ317_014642, partial [Molorchus minor]
SDIIDRIFVFQKKVEKYWPDINEDKEYDGIRVQYLSSTLFANYEFRVFNIYRNDEQRKVEQLHFTSWPDHGVPLYSQTLKPFLQKLLKIPNSSKSPLIVHCRMAAREGFVDFLAVLEHIRSQRTNMVDNIEQYKLAHLAVLECLFGMETSIACNDDIDKEVTGLIRADGIRKQMRYLENTEWQDRAMDTIWEVGKAGVPDYPEKNRFQEIVPEPQHLMYLSYYPHHDVTSSYINAVKVDGFCNPNRYIVTQQPMPNTLGDFWRLVYERKCGVIISLNKIDCKDKLLNIDVKQTCCRFWPIDEEILSPVDFLSIRILEVREIGLLPIIRLYMNSKIDEIPNCKLNPHELSVTARRVCRYTLTLACILVIISDGATASGLYIAMSFIIEKMKLEHECDVCLAVRTIRHKRKEFVRNREQFEFLYRASVTYINGFQSYSNFA